MHPTTMIALGHQVASDRRREWKQVERRWLALRQRRTGATTSPTGMTGRALVRRLRIVPRMLTRPS
jgi:hypothetical protein